WALSSAETNKIFGVHSNQSIEPARIEFVPITVMGLLLSPGADINSDAALKKVGHYFGGIPAGPPVARAKKWNESLNYSQLPELGVFGLHRFPVVAVQA